MFFLEKLSDTGVFSVDVVLIEKIPSRGFLLKPPPNPFLGDFNSQIPYRGYTFTNPLKITILGLAKL